MRKFTFFENTYRQFIHSLVRTLPIIVISFLSVCSAKSQCSVKAGNDTAVCLNSPLSLTATTTGGTATGFAWTTIPATTTFNGNPISISTPTAGTFTYVVAANFPAGSGCAATDTTIRDTVIVTVNPLPTAAFTFSPNNQCGSTPVNFTNTSSGIGLSYSWNFGDPNSGTANTSSATSPIHHFIGTPGIATLNFTVTLIVTSSGGCKDTATQVITIKQSPGTQLGGTGQLVYNGLNYFTTCSTSSSAVFNFTNQSSTAATNVNYTIIWGDASPNFTATGFTTTSHTYTTGNYTLLFVVTGAAPNSCTDTATYYVFVGSNPAVGLNNPGNTTVCSGVPLTFPISGTGTNPPGTIYTVTFNDGSNPTTFIHPAPPGVSHIFSITSCGTTSSDGSNIYPNSFSAVIVASNPCGNSSSGVVPIYVSQRPEASFIISPNDTVCINNLVTLTNTSLSGNTVQNGICTPGKAVWSISPSTGYTYTGTLGNDFGLNDPSTWLAGSNILQLNFTAIGTYTIKLKTGGSTFCSNDSIVKTICVNEVPVAAFNVNQNTGCAPLTVTTTNNSSLTNCGSNTYRWSVIYAPAAGCLPANSGYIYINGTDSTSQNPQFQFINPGVYTINLMAISPGRTCFSTVVTQQITVKAKPNITLTVPPSVCQNQSINPTVVSGCYVTNATYTWSFTSGTPSTSSSQNPGFITYYNTGTFNLSVDVTNECGTTTANSSLIVLASPIADAGIDKNICSGETTQLGAPPVTGLTYAWSPAGGLSSATIANPNVTLITPGVYTYILTVTNSNNCSTKDTVLVTVNPLPIVSVSPSPVSICIGNTTQLTASGADTYVWSPASGLSATTGAIVTANPVITTTYTVTGTITATGCNKSSNVTVNVNPLPVVNAGSDQTLCNQPIPVQLTGSPTGGTWSGSNITVGGVFTPGGTGVFTLVYTYTNGNSCTNTDTAVITVIDPTSVSAGRDTVFCLNSGNFQFAGSPSGGTWSGTNITTGGLFSPSLAGTFNLVYSIGAGTCLIRDTLAVTVNPLPIVSVSPSPISICIGNTTQLTASGADTYSWSPSTGLSATTGTTVTANPVVTTTYTVTGTVTATGCNKSTTITVTVNPLPVVNAGSDQTLCNQPIPVQLTGSPIGGTWSGSNITAGGVFTPGGTGAFNVVYTYTNNNNCTNTDTTVITVIDPTIPNAGRDTAFCLNSGNVQFAGSPSGGTWSGTNITTGGLFSPSLAGTFNLVYSIGAGTCLTRDTVVITVNPLPIILVNPSPVSICIGNTTQLTASGADTYSWSPSTGLSATTGATVTANPVVTTIYTVTGTVTATGCNKSTSVTVTVNPLPVVNAGSDQTLCNQPIPVQLTGSPTGGTWSGSNITAGGVFTPGGTGAFNVVYTYTNNNNCTNTDTAVITVINATIPNAGRDTVLCLNSGNLQFAGSPSGGTWSGTNITTGGLFTPSLAGTFSLVYSIGVNTCLTRDTVVVIVNPLPTVSAAGPNQTVCAATSITLTGNTPLAGTGIWSGANGVITSPNSPTTTVTGLLPGNTYVFQWTITNSVCPPSSDQVQINNLTDLQNQISNTISAICSGQSVTITGANPTGGTGVYIYQWQQSTDGINWTDIPSANLQSYTATLTTSLCFRRKVTSLPCEKYSNIICIAVNPSVSNNIIAANQSICINTSAATITGTTPSGGNGVYNYTWELSTDGGINWSPAPGVNTNINYTPPLPLTQTTIYRRIVSTNLCSGPQSNISNVVTITINQDSKALFTGNPTLHCAPFDLNTAITVTPFPDRNGLYEWFANGAPIGNNSTGVFPGYIINNPGTTVTIKLRTSSQYGCKSDSMQITFNTVVTAVASFTKTPANGCGPLVVTFTNTSNILNNTIQYFWNFGNGNTSAAMQPGTISYSNNPNFVDTTYHITLKAYNGCDTTYYYDSVKVFPNSKARLAVDTTRGCSPFTLHITNTSAGNNFAYYWDFGDGTRDTTYTLGSFIHTYNTGAITTYIIQLISQNQCTRDTQRITLVVSPNIIQPFVTANGNQLSGCAPHVVTFNNSSVGAAQLVWDFGDATPIVITPNSQSTIVHQYNNPGTYTVNIHLRNDCSDTLIQRTIIVYAPPTAGFTVSPLRICTSQSVDVANTSSNANAYEWLWGDATSSTFASGQHSYNNPGIYTITLVAKRVNPSGFICTDTIRKQITVVDKITAQINIDPGKRCVPYTLNVNAGNITGYSLVEWVIYDNSTTQGEFHFNGLSASHIYNSPGTYSAKLIVHTTAGCADSSIVQFQVFNTPQTTFNPKLITTCSHDTTVTFTAAVTANGNNPVTYKWFVNGSIAGTANPFSYHFQTPLNNTAPVAFNIQALAENAAGCGDTSLAGKLIVQPLPYPHIKVTPGLVQSQPFYTFTFEDTVATNPNKTYNWNMGDQNRRNGREVTYKYGDIGSYKVNLQVTDFTTGCSARDSVTVTILFVPGSLYVPNAFYPNSKINDLKTFKPAGIGLEKYHLQIFDAWGKLLFETTELNADGSPKEAWDGTYNGNSASANPNGNPMTQDAFVWKIVEAKFKNGKDWEGMSYNDGPPKRFGTLTLFR